MNFRKFLLICVLTVFTFVNASADEILPIDNGLTTYHTSPRYRASEEHPLRIVSYIIHPIGWLLREAVTRPISYFTSSTKVTRSVFGYRESGDYKDPYCFSSGNAIPDCRSIPPYDYMQAEPVQETSVVSNEIYFPNVNFDFDVRTLNEMGRAKVKQISEILSDDSDVNVVLEGHTDARGSEAYNNTLGMDRAEAVRSELVSLGVSADRLSTVTFGKSRPLVDEATDSARALNRRVEVHNE